MEFFLKVCWQMIDGKNNENENEHMGDTKRIEMTEQTIRD